MWFANKQFDGFSVSLWFNRFGVGDGKSMLVSNGDCVENSSFAIKNTGNTDVVGGIATENSGSVWLDPSPVRIPDLTDESHAEYQI